MKLNKKKKKKQDIVKSITKIRKESIIEKERKCHMCTTFLTVVK